MKNRILPVLLVLVMATGISLKGQEFGYPAREAAPWYYVSVDFNSGNEVGPGSWAVRRVSVNGKRVRDFILLQNGREDFDRVLSGGEPFRLIARCSWRPEQEYRIEVSLEHTESGEKRDLAVSNTAPAGEGYWDPAWKNYLTLEVAELYGHERSNYPIHATVGVLAPYFHSPDEIRVVKLERHNTVVSHREIPCQVYDVVRWADPELLKAEETDAESGQRVTRYHPTVTLSLAFAAELRPFESALYLVFYNHASALAPAYASALRVTGENLGKTVENDFYRIELDPASGMILKIQEKESGILMEHKLETNGAIHWNPGAYAPPHAWTHCSDWKDPEFTEESGPVFYSLKRTAPLPHLDDIRVSIHYYFYAGSPVILMESTMQVMEDLYVKALRNGEVVFNKEVFDHVAYTGSGLQGMTSIDFGEGTRMHPEHVVTLPPDTPWVTFYGQSDRVAFASLFLEDAASSLSGRPAARQQPYIYVQHGPWYYMSKAYVYSFGSNNQTRMLPVHRGNWYYEKVGWIPFTYDAPDDISAVLNRYYRAYKYPVNVREHIETYPESPDGWLVPILTEPFDEGVKGAIGVKKKK